MVALYDTGGLGLILYSISTLISFVHSLDLSYEECNSIGLDRSHLLCSSCDLLKEFELDFLESGCRRCCTEDNANAVPTKYPRAALEVCGWRLGAYPQVQAFVKSSRPEAFPNLTIRYVRGADPIIKLMDEDGDVMETLAIDKWNTDSVEEFLQTYLILPGEENEKSENEI